MWDFFKGWRRKAGCVTLLMAALIAGSWIRSLALYEHAWGASGRFWIAHARGCIHVHVSYEQNWLFSSPSWGWQSTPDNDEESSLSPLWDWTSTSAWTAISVPHFGIVIPLTLLSAYLLLHKTRSKEDAKHDA